MQNALAHHRPFTFAHFRALAWPKEHGSWSLALEPVALGLIVAPSLPGAWFAMAIVTGFFARRPLRTAWRETNADRRADARRMVVALATVALLATAAAVSLAGFAWLIWLLPTALAGGIFLSFDLRNTGRDEVAEIAGAAAFAFLPGTLAVLAGASQSTAVALSLVMCARAVPTVLCVRAALRAVKTGTGQGTPALAAAVGGLGVAMTLAVRGLAPWTAVAAVGVLALRAFGLLAFPRPKLRARTIGILEAGLGIAFVVAVATTWTT